MNKARRCVACVVFQGNIVVSGGPDNDEFKLNTVRSYDVFADKWTSMLYMIHQHFLHSLVTVKNKLFVMDEGRNNCEVFDNIGKKFVALCSYNFSSFNKAMSIGKKIMILQYKISLVLFYDVEKISGLKSYVLLQKILSVFHVLR